MYCCISYNIFAIFSCKKAKMLYIIQQLPCWLPAGFLILYVVQHFHLGGIMLAVMTRGK